MNNEVTQGTADVKVHHRPRTGRLYRPRKLSEIMGSQFAVEDMGPSLKRGMVLKVYKAKVLEAIGTPKSPKGDLSSRAKKLLADLEGAYMKPDEGPGFDNPQLIIKMKDGSPWRQELHYSRMRIKELINERLKSDFLKDVRIK